MVFFGTEKNGTKNILIIKLNLGLYDYPSKTINVDYPPVSKASREEANLTERKNPHTPV